MRQARLFLKLIPGLLLTSSLLFGQFGLGKKKDEAKNREEEVKRAEKAEATYDKLKQFSLDLYASDGDFREDVDKHFDLVQQQHSQEAFDNNVTPPARPTVVNDGD